MSFRMTLRWLRNPCTGTIWVEAKDDAYRPLLGGFRGLDYIFLGVMDDYLSLPRRQIEWTGQ